MSAPTETPVQHPLPRGTIVRVLPGNSRGRAGVTAVIEDYISKEECIDPEPSAFYWASSPDGANDVVIDADKLEVVMTPEQARARTIPTAKRVMDSLGFELLGDFDDYNAYACEPVGDGSAIVTAETHDGLQFTYRVTISEVERTSW